MDPLLLFSATDPEFWPGRAQSDSGRAPLCHFLSDLCWANHTFYFLPLLQHDDRCRVPYQELGPAWATNNFKTIFYSLFCPNALGSKNRLTIPTFPRSEHAILGCEPLSTILDLHTCISNTAKNLNFFLPNVQESKQCSFENIFTDIWSFIAVFISWTLFEF